MSTGLPEGGRLVVVTETLMQALAGQGRVEWGEPDEHGHYTPTIFTAPPSAREQALEAQVARAYTLLVSAQPALHRRAKDAPNATARRLDTMLHDYVVDWLLEYQPGLDVERIGSDSAVRP